MSFILAMVSAVIMMGWYSLRKRKRQPTARQVLVQRYHHPGHGWMYQDADGHVVVGMDDLAQSVLGSVDGVRLPRLLSRVRQGKPSVGFVHGTRRATLLSPVSGRVIEKNEMVLTDTKLINRDPYKDGWLFKVYPDRIGPQLNNLFTGRHVRELLDGVRSRIISILGAQPLALEQDGGKLIQGVVDHCTDEQWKQIQREVFLVDDPEEDV